MQKIEKTPNIREIKIGPLAKAIGNAKAIVLEKWLIWIKNWKGQKHEKNDSTITLGLFFAENRSKKHQIFEKWDKFENRPCCKGYIVFAKWSILVKNWKRQKHAKNHFTITLELFCAKKQSKKHQIFEKWDNLKNGGVLSMHMEFILDSSIRPPGFSPCIWCGKKGEFRNCMD